MSTKQIARATLWQIGSQAAMAALSIVTTRFVYMGLSPDLVGNYNSAYGYLQIFGILADFGLYAVAVKEVSRATEREKGNVLGSMFILRSIILAVSLGIALTIAWSNPAWRGTPLPVGITIAALVPCFTLLAGMLRTVFQVTYKMKAVFVAEVSQRVLTTALIVGTVLLVGLDRSTNIRFYQLFLLYGGLGSLLLFLVSLALAVRTLPFTLRIDRAEVSALFRSALPYGLAFLATAVYRQTDVSLIAALRPDYDIQNAYYGAVQRMADMAYIIPTFLLNSVLPILSGRSERGEDTRGLLGKTLLILLFLGSCTLLFSLLWARPLVSLLTTDRYLSTATSPGSDTVLRLTALPMFLNGFLTYAFYVLLTRHAWRRLLATLATGAVLSVVLNRWLIPPRGFMGASYTSVIVHVILTLLLLPQAQRVLPARIDRMALSRWLIFSLGLGGFLALIGPYLTSDLRTIGGLAAAGAIILVLTRILRIPQLINQSEVATS